MLFSALGMTTAIWLLCAPLLGLESGVRAGLTVTVAVAALVLAPLSVWHRRAGFAMAALGIVLGFANFGLAGSLGALASLAASAVALIVAGMAPQPTTQPAITASGTKSAIRDRRAATPVPYSTAA